MASTHSELDGDELDLTGLVESIVDSDEDDDLPESMDVCIFTFVLDYFAFFNFDDHKNAIIHLRIGIVTKQDVMKQKYVVEVIITSVRPLMAMKTQFSNHFNYTYSI